METYASDQSTASSIGSPTSGVRTSNSPSQCSMVVGGTFRCNKESRMTKETSTSVGAFVLLLGASIQCQILCNIVC